MIVNPRRVYDSSDNDSSVETLFRRLGRFNTQLQQKEILNSPSGIMWLLKEHKVNNVHSASSLLVLASSTSYRFSYIEGTP